jgi:hypothetical protein
VLRLGKSFVVLGDTMLTGETSSLRLIPARPAPSQTSSSVRTSF